MSGCQASASFELAWFLGPNGDPFLGSGAPYQGIDTITRHDPVTLTPACSASVPVTRTILEDQQGLVLVYNGMLRMLDGNCQLTTIADLGFGQFYVVGVGQGRMLALFDPNAFISGDESFVGVRLTDGHIWTQPSIMVNSGQVVSALGSIYLLSYPNSQAWVQKLDPDTGTVLDALDVTGVCLPFGGCSMTVTPDDKVYMHKLGSPPAIYRIQ